MSRTETARRPQAGVTLVEILVVLALIGVVAGAVSLGLSPASRGPSPREEADLLAARMRRASDEVLLTGQAVALVWSERDYRFLALVEGGWAPHPVPLLGQAKTLGDAVHFQGESPQGGFAVDATGLPAGGGPLTLVIGRAGADAAQIVAVTWDGVSVAVSEADG